MGIYPEVSYEHRPEGALPNGRRRKARLLKKISEPGLETIEVYVLQKVIRNRTDCYCCTCGLGDEGLGWATIDAACRNHGYAGRRPCEYHGMPGDAWDNEMIGADADAEEVMPDSVQVYRARRERERGASSQAQGRTGA